MQYNLTFDDKTIPKGQAVIIDGIGEIKNGDTCQITESDSIQFEIRNGVSVVEAFTNNPRFTIKRHTEKASAVVDTDGSK